MGPSDGVAGSVVGDSSSPGLGTDTAPRIKITLDELLRIGTLVRVKTIHNVQYEGHVLACDSHTQQLFLSVQSSSGSKDASCGPNQPVPPRHDVVLLNMNALSALDTISPPDANTPPPTLSQLNVQEIEARRLKNVEKKWKKISCVGVGVSSEGQSLFDKLKNQTIGRSALRL
jgi:hypothetical protein